MSTFKFAVGPWNVHEGADAFGPTVRKSIAFARKIARFKQIGFSAIEFHDDDVVPGIDELDAAQVLKRARAVKKILADNGLKAELVAPRLWESPRTVDGGFTSNSAADRAYARKRSLMCVDIANELDAPHTVLWLAREGTLCAESKDPVTGIKRIVEAVNAILAHDPKIRVLIEPKPNEPIDRSFCPTMGHVMAVSAASSDPSRVGGLLETAHAVLAGLEPANEIAFALAFGKLWGVHLNDQNGMKFDQDKAFGVENLRSAFNQVKVLVDHGYGKNGEYVGLDVKAMRTQKDGTCYRHLENSIKIFKALERKVSAYDRTLAGRMVAERDYEALEMYVMEVIMNG